MGINYPDAQEKRVNVIVKLNEWDKQARLKLSKTKGFGLALREGSFVNLIIAVVFNLLYTFVFNDWVYNFFLFLFSQYPRGEEISAYTADAIYALVGGAVVYFYLKYLMRYSLSTVKFTSDYEIMVIGFGKKDILVRSKYACIKLPYSAVKKAKAFEEGLLIYFESSQRIYIPWRFFSEQSFLYVTNCLNSALRRRFTINKSIRIPKEPQIVQPEEFATAENAPECVIEYSCAKEDYFKYFSKTLRIKKPELKYAFIVVIGIFVINLAFSIIFGESFNEIIYEIAFMLAEFAVGYIAFKISAKSEAKQRTRKMYKWQKGMQRLSVFENCVLNEHENGSWQIIPYDFAYDVVANEDFCLIYGNGGGLFIPQRFAEPHLEAIFHEPEITSLEDSFLEELFAKQKAKRKEVKERREEKKEDFFKNGASEEISNRFGGNSSPEQKND